MELYLSEQWDLGPPEFEADLADTERRTGPWFFAFCQAAQDELVASLRGTIADSERAIDARDEAIASQAAMIDARDDALRSQACLIDERDKEIARLREEVDQLTGKLQAVNGAGARTGTCSRTSAGR